MNIRRNRNENYTKIYFRVSKNNKGFTLIELTIVLVILGLLSAMALPAYLSQAGKSREAGARRVIGAVNRAQQVYLIENNTFTTNYSDLDGFNQTPTAEGYTFVGAMTITANQAIVEATSTSNDLDSQPHLCGISTLNFIRTREDKSSGDGSCPP